MNAMSASAARAAVHAAETQRDIDVYLTDASRIVSQYDKLVKSAEVEAAKKNGSTPRGQQARQLLLVRIQARDERSLHDAGAASGLVWHASRET